MPPWSRLQPILLWVPICPAPVCKESPELGVYCITRYVGKGEALELAEIFGTMLAERYGEN